MKQKKPPTDSPNVAEGFPSVMELHRQWLGKHGLLDRPWFILSSAPGATLPRRLPDGVVHAHVKFAGRAARSYGLPKGDITIATWWKAEREKDITLDLVLRVRPKLSLFGRLKRKLNQGLIRESDLTGEERDDYVLHTMGSRFRGIGEHLRPSSGLTMLAFALGHGIPEIIIAGMSFDSLGHAYNPAGSERKHVAEDRAALRIVATRYPQVTTTEPSLASHTGLPLYES